LSKDSQGAQIDFEKGTKSRLLYMAGVRLWNTVLIRCCTCVRVCSVCSGLLEVFADYTHTSPNAATRISNPFDDIPLVLLVIRRYNFRCTTQGSHLFLHHFTTQFRADAYKLSAFIMVVSLSNDESNSVKIKLLRRS